LGLDCPNHVERIGVFSLSAHVVMAKNEATT
jgi:hypothetical protein